MDWDARALFRLGLGILQLLVVTLLMLGARQRPATWLVSAIFFASALGPAGILRGLQDADISIGGIDMDGGPLFWVIVDSIPFLYLLFVGMAIPHASTAWLRSSSARVTLFGLWFTVLGLGLAQVLWVHAVMSLLAVLVSLYTIAAAVLHFQAAEGPARTRAAWYVAAFVAWDLTNVVLAAANIVWQTSVSPPLWVWDVGRALMASSVVLLAGGLLRGNILAFDHKLLRAGSVAIAAAVLIGGFVAATSLLEERLAGGNSRLEVVVAVVLALLFRPLQSFWQRTLERRFPAAKGVQRMSHSERVQAYREQFELAMADGTINEKEQHMLERFATQLSLSTKDVRSAVA